MNDPQGRCSPFLSRASSRSPGIHAAVASSRAVTTPSRSCLDQQRVIEALRARDHAIYQMESVCSSNRAKEATIAQLRKDKENLEAKLTVGLDQADYDVETRKEIETLRKSNADLTAKLEALSLHTDGMAAGAMLSPNMPFELLSPGSDTPRVLHFELEAPEAIMRSRFSALLDLPVPSNIPNAPLVPILIPTPFILQDFLTTITGPLRIHLANYRIFQENTTRWCPDREEHGYYLTPMFKCSTNPRVVTAHRWHAVDLDSEINRPTECFFNKDGKWYYAGVYKTFRLRDIAPQEWAQLPSETTQALVKETIAHRKNVSPQNVYEVSQLYTAGALKAACIGLQCIGFNETLYRGLLAQADVCVKTGRWRGPPVGVGLGTGAIWNANAGLGHGSASPGAAGAGGDTATSTELDNA